MDSELTIILKQIKQKTGIDIDAYAETKKFSATTREEADWILPSETDFLDVFSDEKNNKTFFHFRFRNANLIGSISGAGDIQKNYAYLIMSLLDSTSAMNCPRQESLLMSARFPTLRNVIFRTRAS